MGVGVVAGGIMTFFRNAGRPVAGAEVEVLLPLSLLSLSLFFFLIKFSLFVI